ncbi:hypothetical protein ElyMa_004094200 [Elysia marginata]|uniref:Uncharacterized protein n=1 Tax=Elysia marginata TaxID=1093978 RepID=A0AAV4GBC2_9GAST|nr:hypothetical protein ElyMa_004094200 [Elysia marginata]
MKSLDMPHDSPIKNQPITEAVTLRQPIIVAVTLRPSTIPTIPISLACVSLSVHHFYINSTLLGGYQNEANFEGARWSGLTRLRFHGQ